MVKRGTLTVRTVTFTEDEMPRDEIGNVIDVPHENTDTYTYFDLSAADAVRVIRDLGLTFDGGRWASNPDGSTIVDYRTGAREEVSAHLGDGWPARVVDAIATAVDAP